MILPFLMTAIVIILFFWLKPHLPSLPSLPSFTRKKKEKLPESERSSHPAIMAELNKELQGETFLTYLELAKTIIESIKEHCLKIELVGSLRRQEPFPGDIDILVVSHNSGQNKIFGVIENVADEKPKWKNSKERLVFTFKGIKCDIIFTSEDRWGMHKLQFTGSREFNAFWKERGKERGFTFHEKRRELGRVAGGYHRYHKVWLPAFQHKTEEEILEELGLTPFKDPALRSL